jgi:hypothetical protein
MHTPAAHKHCQEVEAVSSLNDLMYSFKKIGCVVLKGED